MTEQGPSDPEAVEAKRAAVKLLAHRARPRRYLEGRLREKDFSQDAIESALDTLAEAGYVDDMKYARDRIEGLLRKSRQWGPALVHKLVGDGVTPDLAGEAVAERLADEDQLQWACEVVRERMRTTKTSDLDAERRRLGAYLGRRGFEYAIVIAALEEVLPQSQ